MVQDLVESHSGKIGKLHLDDRPHAIHGRPHGHPHHRILRNGGIHHPTWKLLRQIFCRLERPPESPYVLAVDENFGIIL